MTLREWLESFDCFDVTPVEVTIGRTMFEGCRYRQEMQPVPGARNQEPYVVEAIMLLGELPASYVRRKATAYRLPGDKRDWYVAAWTTETVARDPRYAQYHYGGQPSFQLRPWAHEDAIDKLERYAYERVPVKLRFSEGDPVEVHPPDSRAESQAGLNGPSGSPTSPSERDPRDADEVYVGLGDFDAGGE